jgi:hypothetical protein
MANVVASLTDARLLFPLLLLPEATLLVLLLLLSLDTDPPAVRTSLISCSTSIWLPTLLVLLILRLVWTLLSLLAVLTAEIATICSGP